MAQARLVTGPTRAEVLAVPADPNRPPHPGDQDIRQALEAAEAETRCPRCGQPVTITPSGLWPWHQPDQHPVFAKQCPMSRETTR